MSGPADGEPLAHRHVVAVVLRLVTDRRGELLHGEVVDTSGRVRARFRGWDGLTPAVQGWLRNRTDNE